VDDPLLVGVLDRSADRDEELQALAWRQVVVVAVLVIGTPWTNSMTKYGRPAFRCSASRRGNVHMVLIASACRSASKRAMIWRLSMPDL